METKECKLNLSLSQYKLILESLLFHSSVDVNSRLSKNECEDAFDLIESLRNKYPKFLTENTYVFKDSLYHDQITKKIVDLFPEIVENNPNI